jgi:hypothetical protein
MNTNQQSEIDDDQASKECVLVLVSIPTTPGLAWQGHPYAGWVWVGQKADATRVTDHLESVPALRVAFESGAYLESVDTALLTPAKVRRIKKLIHDRLHTGWEYAQASDSEPALFVPNDCGPDRAWMEPLHDAPFPSEMIQLACEHAEEIDAKIFVPMPTASGPSLSGSERDLLLLMYEHGIVSEDHQETLPQIRAHKNYTGSQFASAMPKLAKCGYAITKAAPGGGSYLTAAGIERASRMKPS